MAAPSMLDDETLFSLSLKGGFKTPLLFNSPHSGRRYHDAFYGKRCLIPHACGGLRIWRSMDCSHRLSIKAMLCSKRIFQGPMSM